MPRGAVYAHRTLPAPTHTPARPGLHIAAAHTSAEEHVEISLRSDFRGGACGDLVEIITLPSRSMWRRSTRSARAEARWPRSSASPRSEVSKKVKKGIRGKTHGIRANVREKGAEKGVSLAARE
eukprot:scaffold120596_cov36-Phaeocystis_antarctica.AAC.1